MYRKCNNSNRHAPGAFLALSGSPGRGFWSSAWEARHKHPFRLSPALGRHRLPRSNVALRAGSADGRRAGIGAPSRSCAPTAGLPNSERTIVGPVVTVRMTIMTAKALLAIFAQRPNTPSRDRAFMPASEPKPCGEQHRTATANRWSIMCSEVARRQHGRSPVSAARARLRIRVFGTSPWQAASGSISASGSPTRQCTSIRMD